MHWMTATPLLLSLAGATQAEPAAPSGGGDTNWRAYVCRVTDWTDCEQNRNARRVYPDPTAYPDRDSCLAGFGQRFETDPAIQAKYPQTSDPGQSFVFDCEAVR